MRYLLRQYKIHKMIDYATIGAGVGAVLIIPSFLENGGFRVAVGSSIFLNFYLVRSILALLHFAFSRNFRNEIVDSSYERNGKLLDNKLEQYPAFSKARSIFRLINICILTFMLLFPISDFFSNLFYVNVMVIVLCVIERLYLEKVAKFDVSGEYLIKMNEARFSEGSFSHSEDIKSGIRCDSMDPGNPSSITYSTSYYSSRNHNFH